LKLRSPLLSAITVTFGLQLWRALVPLLVAVLHNRFGWGAAAVGTVAFAVLLTGFLAGRLRRWRLGPRKALAMTVAGTGLLRLAMQLWTGDPAVELGLALAGSLLFILALPCLVSDRTGNAGHFAAGALLGLALDLSLHGFWHTYDLGWQGKPGPFLVTAVLFLTQVTLLARETRQPPENGNLPAPYSPSLAWLGVGPYFLLTLLAGQNVARLTVITGWEQAPAFLWMAAGQALTLAGVICLARSGPAEARTMAVAGLFLLFGALLLPWPAGAWAAAGYLLGHAGSALALVGLLAGLSAAGRPLRWQGLALAQAATVLLFAVLVYFYHFHFADPASPSPFFSHLLPLGPAVLFAISTLSVTWPARAPQSQLPFSWRPALLAIALLALPLYRLATVQRPTEDAGRYPLRVMTYNVHNGFDTSGDLGLEALATVIEAEQPDVVMLQEIPRGMVIYGTTDALAWLAQRLGMRAHFAPTADALWGLGTLSRLPVVEDGATSLPPDDLLIRRGVQSIVVDSGAEGQLTVVNTHFHHPQADSDVRVLQARAVVKAWQGTMPLVVGGDLNARPPTPEIQHFVEAGWQDVVEVSGARPGYTFPSSSPYERIDYLWLSPDLAAAEVTVPSSPASDHLPVVATIGPARLRTRRARNVTHMLGLPFSSTSTHVLPLYVYSNGQRPCPSCLLSRSSNPLLRRGSEP